MERQRWFRLITTARKRIVLGLCVCVCAIVYIFILHLEDSPSAALPEWAAGAASGRLSPGSAQCSPLPQPVVVMVVDVGAPAGRQRRVLGDGRRLRHLPAVARHQVRAEVRVGAAHQLTAPLHLTLQTGLQRSSERGQVRPAAEQRERSGQAWNGAAREVRSGLQRSSERG